MPDKSRAAHLNPRAPLVVDTRELGRRAGSMRRLQVTVPAPRDLGVELIGVPPGADLQLDLRLEAVVEGVLVSGTVVAPLVGECGRCLDPVTDEVEVELSELFAYEDSTTSETTDEDEAARMDGDYLDLEPALRDAVVLGLPLAPLCRESCPGLCVTCGEPLTEGEGQHDHVVVDPRWAALQSFTGGDDGAASGTGHDE